MRPGAWHMAEGVLGCKIPVSEGPQASSLGLLDASFLGLPDEGLHSTQRVEQRECEQHE